MSFNTEYSTLISYFVAVIIKLTNQNRIRYRQGLLWTTLT